MCVVDGGGLESLLGQSLAGLVTVADVKTQSSAVKLVNSHIFSPICHLCCQVKLLSPIVREIWFKKFVPVS